MAEDLTVSRPVTVGRGEKPKRRRGRVHARRFAVAYALLALALAGAGVLLFYALDADPAESREWSSWRPTADGEAQLWQIADHVAPHYRDDEGRVAAKILAGPPSITVSGDTGPARVAVDGFLIGGRASDRSDARGKLFNGDAAMYVLCGSGDSCALGPPWLQKPDFGVSLQRWALELALYTFKYVDGINSVLVFNPPVPQVNAQGQAETVRTLVYLERDDVREQLERPLRDTVFAPSGLELGPIEQDRVLRIVRPHLFNYKPDQAPNGATILSLARFDG